MWDENFMRGLAEFSEYQAGVVPSETEGIAHGDIDFSFLGLVQGQV